MQYETLLGHNIHLLIAIFINGYARVLSCIITSHMFPWHSRIQLYANLYALFLSDYMSKIG